MPSDVTSRPDRPRPWLLGVVLAYVAVVLLLPLAALAWGAATSDLPRSFRSLSEPKAVAALSNTLLLAGIAVVANGVFGLAAAIVIVRQRFVGRACVEVLAELPLSISPVMTGLGIVLVFGRGGLLSPALESTGMQVVFAFPGLVLATLFVTLPFTVREVANVLTEIGTNEEEAATMLGASPWRTFVDVTLPNVRAALGYGTLLTSARALGEFGAVLVVGGAISGRTHTATTYLYGAFEERDRTTAYGIALVLVAVCLVSFALLARRVLRRA